MWVGLLLGLLVATVVGLLLAIVARRRGKETQFGYEVRNDTKTPASPGVGALLSEHESTSPRVHESRFTFVSFFVSVFQFSPEGSWS